ncbi:MAG: peptidylprolyl isomerase [Candidatus Omnitrophica bacterium]|nr:peptidylprolyl isomerase [Candidatus Omnitrophota bacterium]
MTNPNSNTDPSKKLYLIISIILVSAVIIYAALLTYKKFFPSCVAGTINNQKVTCEQFNNAYTHHLITSQMQYGQLFEQFKPLLKLKEQTWEKIIIAQEAKKQGIKIPDQKIVETIAGYDMFFNNGVFNKQFYREFVNSTLKTKIPDFEESIRDSLLLKALFDKITAGVTVNENDIKDEFLKENTLAQLLYIEIPAKEPAAQVKIEDTALKTYFEQHKNLFDMPTTVKIEYVTLDFPADGGIQKQVEMKYKGKAIIDDYIKNKDLAIAAKKLNFKLQTTDYISLSEADNAIPEWPLPLINDIMQMNVGSTMTEPYEIKDKGYVIIKLIDRKQPFSPTLEQVNTKVTKAYNKEQEKLAALKQAQELFEKFKSITSADQFKQLAKDTGFEVKDSKEIPLQQIPMALELNQEEENQLTGITKTNLTLNPIKNINGAAIAFVSTFKPADMSKFETNKKEIQETLLNAKKDKVFEEYRNKLMKENVIKY